MSGLDPELRALLVCPACRGELRERLDASREGPDALRCPQCMLDYPVVQGVPYLVPELAVEPR